MKKLSAICLVSLYLVLTGGITLNVGYCRDRVTSVKVDILGKPSCGVCGTAHMGSSCCRDEVKFVKLGTTHLSASGIHLAKIHCSVLPLHIFTIYPSPERIPSSTTFLHGPPGSGNFPQYLLLSKLLI